MEDILKILVKIREILAQQDEINSLLWKRIDKLNDRLDKLDDILVSKDNWKCSE